MPESSRFYSLDVFRGATVAAMILVNNPGSWSHIYEPLDHAPWHGCTFTDLVFPFFLFAVGNALSFVLPRFEAAGTAAFLKKVIKRSCLIYLVGVLLNWSPFVRWQENMLVFKHPADIRLTGVLQRIALCYLFASLIIYFFKTRGAFFAGAVILLSYWLLCLFLGNPSDPYSMEGFWGTPIDRLILGTHIYKGERIPFDPEGLISAIPAIVQVIFGYITGQYIQQKGKNYEMVTNLFVAGLLLMFAGYCWDMVFPINKKIWTSSYVVYTSGLAIAVLAVLVYLVELRGFKASVMRFFDVFGKNPLFIFVLSGFLPRALALIRINDFTPEGKSVYLSPFGWFYEHVCKPLFTDPRQGSLLYAIITIAFYWCIVYWLDKKRIYFKL